MSTPMELEISAADSHGITHPKKRSMLAALSKTGNISAAARAAQICRRTHYDWLDSDPSYCPAVRQAWEEAADVLEACARKRALIGSDTLLIFLLKSVRPEKFRERYEVEHKRDTQQQALVDSIRRGLIRMMTEYPEIANAMEDEVLGISLPAPKET